VILLWQTSTRCLVGLSVGLLSASQRSQNEPSFPSAFNICFKKGKNRLFLMFDIDQ
jgi:hypothetical protein